MRTAVVTDSNSGIFPQEAAKLGIYVVPMPILIDDNSYYEGVDITLGELLKAQSSGRQVTSSQPSPEDVTSTWDQALEKYDELVYVPMSSGLSGSCASAKALSETYGGRVRVADSHRISVTLRVSITQAIAMAKAGRSAAEIQAFLEQDAYSATIYIAVNTLEYLKRSGRVTSAGAALGSVLNIKPVLTIQGDKLDAFMKVRGMQRAESCMLQALKEDIHNRFSDAPGRTLVVMASGSFAEPKAAKRWQDMVKSAFPRTKFIYDPLPLSVVCHTGPDAAGVGAALV